MSTPPSVLAAASGSGRKVYKILAGVPGLTGPPGPQGPQGSTGPGASLGTALTGGSPNNRLYLDSGGLLANVPFSDRSTLPPETVYANAANVFTSAQTVRRAGVPGVAAFKIDDGTTVYITIDEDGKIDTAGEVTAAQFTGSGAGLTDTPATIGTPVGGGTTGYVLYVGSSGKLAQEATVATSRLPAIIAYKSVPNTFTKPQVVIGDSGVAFTVRTTALGAAIQEWQIGAAVVASITAAGGFAGDGSQLTALSAAAVSSGTLADARLSANVPLLNAANVFTAAQRVTFPTTGANAPVHRGYSTPLAADLWSFDDAGNLDLYADLSAARVFADLGGSTGYPASAVDGIDAYLSAYLAARGVITGLSFDGTYLRATRADGSVLTLGPFAAGGAGGSPIGLALALTKAGAVNRSGQPIGGLALSLTRAM